MRGQLNREIGAQILDEKLNSESLNIETVLTTSDNSGIPLSDFLMGLPKQISHQLIMNLDNNIKQSNQNRPQVPQNTGYSKSSTAYREVRKPEILKEILSDLTLDVDKVLDFARLNLKNLVEQEGVR